MPKARSELLLKPTCICVEFDPEVIWSIMVSFIGFMRLTSMPGTSTWKMLTFRSLSAPQHIDRSAF